MANPWGGGGDLIVMPTSPWPAKLELGSQTLAAQNTNPFTGAQQTQDWQGGYRIGSATMPPLAGPDVNAWMFFLGELRGVVNVFQWMPALCANPKYSWMLTNNLLPTGASKYFRLTSNELKFSISPGGITRVSFEFREAL